MYDNLVRQTLLLLVGAYCFAKEIVKNICFFLKIGYKIIINKTQMYIGTFLSLKKIFIIGKKVFSLGLIAWIVFFLRLRNYVTNFVTRSSVFRRSPNCLWCLIYLFFRIIFFLVSPFNHLKKITACESFCSLWKNFIKKDILNMNVFTSRIFL